MAAKPTHLEPSELGTKEYWDNLYTNELTNHEHDPADTGTNWFEDSDAQEKLIEFLDEFLLESSSDEDDETKKRTKKDTSFLDLGTGNGDMLFGLRDAGWTGPMLGVDYSERSVEFAQRIEEARRKGLTPRHTFDDDADDSDDEQEQEQKQSTSKSTTSSPPRNPSPPNPPNAGRGWDVVLDKGTFDAISLSSETDPATGRRVSENYRARVLPLVREGGLFLVTSCNWTEDELDKWFAGEQQKQEGQEEEQEQADEEERRWRFQQVGRVEYPSFSFGGVKGRPSAVCVSGRWLGLHHDSLDKLNKVHRRKGRETCPYTN
ncbi:S-adenosyl-L-methionine-dependent methyltransferase [Apiospora hydei]|uniref:Protein-lysine N-methyltransferase EFM4 n=1 Tax=Apiospora hydei TaxID=1337664 RepID=A0ABR1UT61_9PEZI